MRSSLLLVIIFGLIVITGCSNETIARAPIIDPLSVSLQSNVLESELSIQTTLECNARGGKEPFAYEWNSGSQKLDCTNELCEVYISEIGTHEILCAVTDSRNETKTAIITLDVLKKVQKVDHIIAIGDSLTFGETLSNPSEENWISLLSENFESASIENYAISGARTEEVIKNQLPLFQQRSNSEGHTLIFLWIGANDANTLIPLDQFEQQYRQIVSELADVPDSTFVILNIPDFSELQATKNIDSGLNDILGGFGLQFDLQGATKELIGRYNSIVENVAAEHGIVVIDTFSIMNDFDAELIADDGFHPNKAGHEFIAETVEEELEKKFSKIEFQ